MIISAAARRNWVWWALMGVVSVVLLVWAGSSTPEAGTGDERLFALAGQLKCLQCVGESVAASQAPLAQQFRDEIREQMDSGATDDEILVFFAQRYGDEVLLEPPSRGVGALVWVLPVLLVGGLVVVLVVAFGRWRRESGEAADDAATAGDSGEPVPAPRRSWRTPVTLAGVGVVVVLAIVALTRGTGERGDGEMTGGTGTLREELARCQPLAMREPEEALACYDAILEDDPDNVEALTYRGWANIRADNIAEGGGDLTRAVELDPTYPDARVFRAIVSANAGDFDTASDELTVFFANDPSAIATQIVASEGLERKIFFGLMDPATRGCWQQAAGEGGDAIDQAFLDALSVCLDGVLATDPTNRYARLSKALSTYGYEGDGAAEAQPWIDGLLAEDPADADALSLQVTVDLATGDLENAQDGIDQLRDLPRAPAAFLIGDPDALQAALDAAREAEVPNPDGG